MKNMNNNVSKVQQIIEKECLQAIEDAKKGQLSPYWQKYHLNNILCHKETHLYPQNGDFLLTQLQSAIAQVAQISDAQQTAKELSAIGSELIFFYTEEPDTILEISYSAPLHTFSCNVDLDTSLTAETCFARLKQMRSALERWVDASGAQWTPNAYSTAPATTEMEYFTTLTDVLSYLFHWLDTRMAAVADRLS